MLILLITAILLIIPGYLLYSLWKSQESSQFKWLLKVVYTGAFLLFILLVGRWDWISYYLRYLLAALFALATFISYRRVKDKPVFLESGRNRWKGHGSAMVELLIMLGLLAFTLRGYFFPQGAVHLAFPLQNGRYYVGQGGNSVFLNYHNISRSQRYALDVVELNSGGRRAWGINPSGLEDYVIFGTPIHSPCDGVIREKQDGLPDQIPPASDRDNPAGNHVVITCNNVQVVLAHMKTGSVVVEAGQTVSMGQLLGQVGNSGNTTEPHLHIHAVKLESESVLSGEGVPMVFDGKFPIRNTVIANTGE